MPIICFRFIFLPTAIGFSAPCKQPQSLLQTILAIPFQATTIACPYLSYYGKTIPWQVRFLLTVFPTASGNVWQKTTVYDNTIYPPPTSQMAGQSHYMTKWQVLA